MNVLEMMGIDRRPRSANELSPLLPIVFPALSGKAKYNEFFHALEKCKSVRYSWKHGKLIVRGHEPLGHEEFAAVLGRFIPTAADLFRLLAISGINYKITEWKGYLPESEVKALEGIAGILRLRLPAPPNTETSVWEMMGLDGSELLRKKSEMGSISFPVNSETADVLEFFRVLEKVRRVTYNWGKGLMYLIDNSDPKHVNNRTISHEDFAKAIGRNITTSVEMLLVLSLSGITFRVTNVEDFLSEEQVTEFLSSFLDTLTHTTHA